MDPRNAKRTIILAATVVVILVAVIIGLVSMESAINSGLNPSGIPTIPSDLPTGTDTTPEIRW